jgi:hypothetical protein
MDNAAGEDLSWFWNEWFFTTWKLDQSVKQIAYTDSDPAKGSLITIENTEGMALPVTVAVKEENGNTGRVNLPAEVWQRVGTWTFAYKSTSKINYVVLDPDHVLPDINPENNALTGVAIDKSVTAKTVIKSYVDAVGGEERLKDVKDLTVTSEGTIQGFKVVRISKNKVPDMSYQDVTVPAYNNFNVSHVVINGDSLSVKMNGRPLKFDSKTDKESVKVMYKLFPELDFNKPGYSLKLDSALKVINGQLAYEITVTQPDGIGVKYFYDQKTGLKVKQYTDVPNSARLEFSNYQSIATGVKIPFTELNNINGDPIEYKIVSAVPNTAIPNETFKYEA